MQFPITRKHPEITNPERRAEVDAVLASDAAYNREFLAQKNADLTARGAVNGLTAKEQEIADLRAIMEGRDQETRDYYQTLIEEIEARA